MAVRHAPTTQTSITKQAVADPEGEPDDIAHLVQLHREHHTQAPAAQQALNRVTVALARPLTVILTVILVTAWIVWNATAASLHVRVLDEIPFPELSLALAVVAVVVALLILSTQRFDSELEERRAELTLQIALLSERKIAKLIELMEEQRRDNPLLRNRIDADAETLSQPSDPAETLNRLQSQKAVAGLNLPGATRSCHEP